MRAIMVMFDTLRRDYLEPYGSLDTITPNFKRLAEKTVQFNQFHAGSLPCMPARRELHTGRYNFLHRGWGPVEPFDDSCFEILKKNGVYTHLVTDHKHYWRDGGATYHPRYSSYEFIRGQEGDNWKAVVDKKIDVTGSEKEDKATAERKAISRSQHHVNRSFMPNEEDHHLAKTIGAGIEFLETNVNADNWLLQIECFDPHEPFFVPKKYLKMYGIENEDDVWPTYSINQDSQEKTEKAKRHYKALITMCDAYLGKVLDYMDEHDMWKDTMLIVNTDHGFLLGEHEWWGKNIMPVYDEISHTPFFIWDPKLNVKNEQRESIAQTIDIPATILDYFNIEQPKDMQGISLKEIIKNDKGQRKNALFGYFGANINITNGKNVYMRAPLYRTPHNLYEYTLMPTRINRRFTTDELKNMELVEPLSFTKNCKVLKIECDKIQPDNYRRFGNKLFDLEKDPNQKEPLNDIDLEFEMIMAMKELMKENDCPEELYAYYGLDKINSKEDLEKEYEEKNSYENLVLFSMKFESASVKEGFLVIEEILDDNIVDKIKNNLIKISEKTSIKEEDIFEEIRKNVDKSRQAEVLYKAMLAMRIE